MGIHGDQVTKTALISGLTGDTALKGGPGYIYWMHASTGAGDAIVVQFENHPTTVNTGDVLFDITLGAGDGMNCVFDPPLFFSAGIFYDEITFTGSGLITVGYE